MPVLDDNSVASELAHPCDGCNPSDCRCERIKRQELLDMDRGYAQHPPLELAVLPRWAE